MQTLRDVVTTVGAVYEGVNECEVRESGEYSPPREEGWLRQ